jgi:hypothetical protein
LIASAVVLSLTFFFSFQSIVGVPPEIREENDNFTQAIPVQ